MRLKHFFSEPVLIDHDLEIDVHIFPRGLVVGFLFFLFPFEILHLDPTLFSLLLNFLELVHWVPFASLHLELI
jgi:hypothetical protein